MSKEKEEFGHGTWSTPTFRGKQKRRGANKGNWKLAMTEKRTKRECSHERKRGRNSVKYCIGLVS